MRKRSMQLAAGVALALCAAAPATPAQAGDFFSNLFGAFGVHRQAPQPPMALPFANDEQQPADASRMRTSFGGGGQAWCVRTCDGRYFPISGPDAQSKTESCNGFCPASKTDIVYGNDIDHAVTANGKRYSELPNASNTVTSSLPAVPVPARIRRDSRRCRSTKTLPCARATSSPATTDWWLPIPVQAGMPS
jgi:hypothetical protein